MALNLDGTTGITSDSGTPVIENLNTTATGIDITGQLTTTGNVGIGTSSPTRLLQLNSSTTEVAMKLTNSTSGSGSSDGTDIKYEGLNLSINNREAGSIIFETNNISRATIDSAGRVTMPYQPVVSATRNSDFGSNGAAQSIINFEGVQVNVGNHYNNATGIFTCPVNGTYRITAYGMVRSSTSNGVFVYNAATARHNGSQIGGAAYNYGDGYVHISGNWMINASAGDALSVYMSSCLGGYGGLTIELIG